MMRMILSSVLFLCGCTPSIASNALSVKEVPHAEPSVGSKAQQQTAIDDDLHARLLTHDVWVVQDKSFHETNVMVARMPDGTVIIASSFIDTVKTKKLIDWVKRSFKPKEIRSINTHFHFDGTGGNEAYDNEGVETWSSQQTLALYQGRANSMRSSLAGSLKGRYAEDLKGTRNAAAKNSFDAKDGLNWDFQGEKVIVYYPGPAHSPDNLVVYLPSKKILFGGCMVRGLSYDIGNIQDADLKAYKKSALALRRFPADIVIPGHGQVGSKDLIDHTIDLAAKASL